MTLEIITNSSSDLLGTGLAFRVTQDWISLMVQKRHFLKLRNIEKVEREREEGERKDGWDNHDLRT